MKKWQEVLSQSGLSVEKLRKKVKEDIADYNDALAYIESAKEKLKVTTDEANLAEINNDIKEIEEDLPGLNDQIIAGIDQDVATLEKRRVTAKKAFAGKEGGKANKPAPAPQPAPQPTNTKADPVPPAAQPSKPDTNPDTAPIVAPNDGSNNTQLAAGGSVSDPNPSDPDKGKNGKGSGFGVTEIVVGGVLGVIGIGLGLHYIYPDLFTKLFKKK